MGSRTPRSSWNGPVCQTNTMTGDAKVDPHDPPEYRTWGNVGLWAISGLERFNQIYHQTDVSLVNVDNMLGLYAFHPGGAHISLVDGAVRVLADSVDAEVVMALVSRDGNEATEVP